ncbi:MAG: DNA-binding protein WhiA [Candidatus Limiplasma sp.]|nr:DNA-binding protein WhiA [Candidatus Limiplasma sp.]MEA5146085.1 DNA-binding protein WhiA [Candidatus Limiplasma sp.]
MSFSSDTKEELCRVASEKPCCRLSELGALYMTLGALSLLGRGQLSVQFTVESPAIARRIFVLLQKEIGIIAQLHYVSHARFGGRRKCVLTVGPHQAPALLMRFGMVDALPDAPPSLRATAPRVRLTRDCCRRAFLRGALLGCGTLSNPETSYHLEFTARDEALRLNIAKCLQSLDVPVKQTVRRGVASLYVKQSDQIATILTAAGAHMAVTTLESMRVRRQVLGTVNRAMNCDNANLQKQMDASEKQLESIAALIQSDRFATLPPALQAIARARTQYPDLSLEELGATLSPPIGKSGVNHRMRRLVQLAGEDLGGQDAPQT